MIKKHFNSTGDTIVEVLISIAIVSLVLAISYATVHHNASSIQDAQERSQALQLASRQVELLKANAGPNQIDPTATPTEDCFASDGTAKHSSGTDASDECEFMADGGKVTVPGFEPAYHIKVSLDSVTGTYSVAVTWDNLINARQYNLTLYYRPS